MKGNFSASMANGPQLNAFWEGLHYFGAYHPFKFGEEERGKKLTVTVDSHNRSVCWIELWPASFDGKDSARWATQRGSSPIVSTGHSAHPNPSFTWTIEPGEYTVYFVNSSKSSQVYDEIISFQVEVK